MDTVRIWARVGMDIEVSKAMYEQFLKEATDENGIIQDLDNPAIDVEELYKQGKARFDGDVYIPQCALEGW